MPISIGSIWKPGSPAEQIIIIVYLAFTLVIYNSYSAFITSVLSIKLTNIRTVGDLLNSDYEIGYVRNSQDEIYLRVSISVMVHQRTILDCNFSTLKYFGISNLFWKENENVNDSRDFWGQGYLGKKVLNRVCKEKFLKLYNW